MPLVKFSNSRYNYEGSVHSVLPHNATIRGTSCKSNESELSQYDRHIAIEQHVVHVPMREFDAPTHFHLTLVIIIFTDRIIPNAGDF